MEEEYLVLNDFVLNMEYQEAIKYLYTINDVLKREILTAYFYYKSIQYELSLSTLESVSIPREHYFFTETIRALAYFALGDTKYIPIVQKLENEVDDSLPDYVYLNYLILRIRSYSMNNPKECIGVISEALTLANKIHDNRSIIGLYGDKGVIYRMLGMYQEAESAFKKQLELLDGIENGYLKYVLFANLAMIMFHQKRFNTSMEYIGKALEYKDFSNNFILAQIYFIKMYIFLLQSDEKSAESAYNKISDLLDNVSKTVATRDLGKLSDAIWYKHKSRLKHTVIAQSYLEEIIYSEITDYELYFIALVNLIDILVNEYSHSRHPEVLQEITKLDCKLAEFCTACNTGLYYIESYQLRARLLFFRQEVKLAIDVLSEGIENTDDAEAISELKRVKSKFVDQLKEWKKLADSNKGLLAGMTEAEIKEYLAEVVRIVQ